LILDIELYDLNGIEVGKIVREKMFNEVMHIIYISSKESYAMELTLSIKNGGWIMKKIFSVLLVFTILVLSTNDGFADK
jgi:two-component SAPR family response regulator